jgi:membrane protease YdiL (CAAX protease family)
MMTPTQSALVKAAVAGAAIVLVLFRTKHLSREEIGLVRPAAWPLTLAIMLFYVGWMLATNALIGWRGAWDWTPWLAAPLLASILRVLAVGLLGPIAEELIFRGWFFALLRTRVGVAATLLLTSAGWAMLHYDYSWAVIGVILVDGLLLGLARLTSRSVWPPVVMHILYNLYAVW